MTTFLFTCRPWIPISIDAETKEAAQELLLSKDYSLTGHDGDRIDFCEDDIERVETLTTEADATPLLTAYWFSIDEQNQATLPILTTQKDGEGMWEFYKRVREQLERAADHVSGAFCNNGVLLMRSTS